MNLKWQICLAVFTFSLSVSAHRLVVKDKLEMTEKLQVKESIKNSCTSRSDLIAQLEQATWSKSAANNWLDNIVYLLCLPPHTDLWQLMPCFYGPYQSAAQDINQCLDILENAQVNHFYGPVFDRLQQMAR